MNRRAFVEKYLRDAFDPGEKFRNKLHHFGMIVEDEELIEEISNDLEDNFTEEMINAAKKSGFPGMKSKEEFFDALTKELSNLSLSIQNKPKKDVRRRFAEQAARGRVDWDRAEDIIQRRPRNFPLLGIIMRQGRWD